MQLLTGHLTSFQMGLVSKPDSQTHTILLLAKFSCLFFPITPQDSQTAHLMTPKVSPSALIPNVLQLYYVPFPSPFKTPPPLPAPLSLTNGDHSCEPWGNSRASHESLSPIPISKYSLIQPTQKHGCHRTTASPHNHFISNSKTENKPYR